MPRSAYLLLLAFIAVPATAQLITQPAELGPGDQYRLMFLPIATTTAESSDIDTYNQYANRSGNFYPQLVDLGTTWAALVSTPTVNARDNTGTNPFDPSHISVPIYTTRGELVAHSNADLWDGSISTPPDHSATGQQSPWLLAWSGTDINGAASSFPLGADEQMGTAAEVGVTGSSWINTGRDTFTGFRFAAYAVSDVITVAAVPEPSTLAAAITLMAAAVSRSTRRHHGLADTNSN